MEEQCEKLNGSESARRTIKFNSLLSSILANTMVIGDDTLRKMVIVTLKTIKNVRPRATLKSPRVPRTFSHRYMNEQ